MVWEPRVPKTSPSYCLTRPRGSSRPVVATTSRGATSGWLGRVVQCCGSYCPKDHEHHHEPWCPRRSVKMTVWITWPQGRARQLGQATASRPRPSPRLVVVTTDRGRSRGPPLGP
ncbi:hypothetical protein MTR67_018467 [Solanum verrucosum]|uniref:Uncharacterized protein n=1 Tax=Solanum verrucosum TaxID=315347 RepID=A0AAF0QLS8_SOLVR|nr:hypothetical protein MTR67_018467 [Solanum verrucosum]